MPLRAIASIRFLILVLTSLIVGLLLSSPSGWMQGPPPPILSDDFNDNSIDTTKWNADNLFSGFTDMSLPIAETLQRLEIGPLLLNTPESHYRGLRSVNSYNFTGSYSYVELVQAASSTTSADAMFTIGNDVNAYYRIYVSAGVLYGLRKIGPTKITLFTTPYNAVNHRFLRIRHDSATGNVTLDTAPSNSGVPGTWVQRYAEGWNSSILLGTIIFEVKGGTWQAESNAPDKVIFDNFQFGNNGSAPGRIELYVRGVLFAILQVRRNQDLLVGSCEPDDIRPAKAERNLYPYLDQRPPKPFRKR